MRGRKVFLSLFEVSTKSLRRQDHEVTVIAKIIQYTINKSTVCLNLSTHLLITAEDESIDLKYTVELLIVH